MQQHQPEYINNLIRLRKQYGLSKKQMARLLGIGIGSLNKLERQEIPPRLPATILIRVYQMFGVLPSAQLTRRLPD